MFLLFNKTPRDMTKAENIAEAMTRSVMPLWGEYTVDILSGEYDSFGRSFIKDLAGPTAGAIDKTAGFLSSLALDLADGKRSGKKSMTRGLQLLQQELPGSYIPILRPILEKTLWDGLYRWNNVNYDKRLKKGLKRKGQEFLIQ